MTSVWERLSDMLRLEREHGYTDKAVIGGLETYVPAWREGAICDLPRDAGRELIDEIAGLMARYSQVADSDERQGIVARISDMIAARPRLPEVAGIEPPAPPAVPQPAAPVMPPPSAAQPRPVRARMGGDDPLAALNAPVSVIAGISTGYAHKLEKLGTRTIIDLLYLFPRRYIDYSKLLPIRQLQIGDEVTVIGQIFSVKQRASHSGMALVQAIVADTTGTIEVTWFNQPYLAQRLRAGRTIVLSGKVDQYLGRAVMSSPEWEAIEREQIHTARLVPVYPLTAGIGAHWLRKVVHRAVEYWARRLPDHVPQHIVSQFELMPLGEALRQVHFPDNVAASERARHRLAFDEFFLIQLGVLRQRRAWRAESGRPLTVDYALLQEFRDTLPFQFTGAQNRALQDVLNDVQSAAPMSRLLQGDVGSGKTVVATAAMLAATSNGCQAAIMAPTEILAEQHYKTITRLLEGMTEHPVRIALLTGSTPKSERESLFPAIASGEIQIVVGTHALIQGDVEFSELALVVVDEQHRFGVQQRGALRQKGYNPHMLVMSATPIPRTLSLTLYGDLDVSIIDELPPGRQTIKTHWMQPRERERAYSFIRQQVEKGRQAFVICPLVEGSDRIEAKAAVEEYERLSKEIYPTLRLGLLHGRMRPKDKEKVMNAFYRRELDVLVSTSVVEVGIDVPNATVMLVEGANRFGLAQLHQFRGRVGRGEHESHCLLLADMETDNARDRLRTLEETTDGFKLAEKDLEMRGPGEFFGTAQSGMPSLRVAQLGDTRTLTQARQGAQLICDADCDLALPEHSYLARKLKAFWASATDLS